MMEYKHDVRIALVIGLAVLLISAVLVTGGSVAVRVVVFALAGCLYALAVWIAHRMGWL